MVRAYNKKLSREDEIERLRGIIEDSERVEAENLLYIEEYKRSHLWEYFNRFSWQDRCLELARGKMIVLSPAPNGIGKTTLMVNILMSWICGYEGWFEVDAGYSGAVKVGDKWYRGSSLGIKPPVRLRVTGEDWNHHLGQVVVPEMKKWFSVDEFDTKRNTSGVEYFWTHKSSGSTLELMTHDQDIKLFESWRGHGWCADEPPKYDIFKAMSRGLAENRGKMFFASTPLKEAWMLDELILKNRSDVGVMKDLTLFDNEISFENDVKILDDIGVSGKGGKYWRECEGEKRHFFDLLLYKDDLGVEAEKYIRGIARIQDDIDKKIMDLIFLKRAKDTSIDEKPSRFFGMFKKLVGLVIKEFNNGVHIVKGDDDIPVNWIVTFEIDFHLGKPHAIVFYACSERNIHYVIDEVWENMTPEEIADFIIRKKVVNGWNINYGEIDPLSKGDDKYMKNRDADAVDSFTIIEEKLDKYGIELGVASKDKRSGISNIKSWLKGVNRIPILYFFDTLRSVNDNAYGVVYELQRLCYDENGMPEKVNDHFIECLYRYTLANVEYKEKKEDLFSYKEFAPCGKESWML